MSEFKDATGQSWLVEIDGLSLGELKDAGIDIVQDGLYAIEGREDILAKSLLILCKEQRTAINLTDKQFAKRLSGPVADVAIEAVRGAAQSFFRPSRWSEIQSHCNQKKTIETEFRGLQPVLDLLNRPEMPAAMREAVMGAIAEQIHAVTSSRKSETTPSVSGQVASQANVAGDLLASLESIRAA